MTTGLMTTGLMTTTLQGSLLREGPWGITRGPADNYKGASSIANSHRPLLKHIHARTQHTDTRTQTETPAHTHTAHPHAGCRWSRVQLDTVAHVDPGASITWWPNIIQDQGPGSLDTYVALDPGSSKESKPFFGGESPPPPPTHTLHL